LPSFNDIEEIYIPKVYWDFTSKSVLVMEHIEGIKMDRVDEIRRQGIDPQEVAMIGLRSFSRQFMDSGIFHADPHPGNTIVMPDGRVSLVDFGIVGYLDEETMLQIAHLFLGLPNTTTTWSWRPSKLPDWWTPTMDLKASGWT
jgi:ubiquinone biosynthesis protein